jgi:CheY-like chemotaxis protein/CRP-like cAMP-binding protein
MSQKILIIEDNKEVRENTAELLELAGYQVEVAENGKLGVAKAKEYTPDLIICDIMMPQLDGYGVLNMLSHLPETSKIPFVFLTAKADKSDFRKGMNLGADDYLTKPFDENDLLDVILIRLKKAESFQSNYSNGLDGLNDFIDKVQHDGELQKLSDQKNIKSYGKKETIYYSGDFASAVYLLVSGKLKISNQNLNAKEYITELVSPGEYFGYASVLMQTERNATATVLEDAKVRVIRKEDFEKLIYENKEIAAQFIHLLAGSVRQKEETLLRLAFQSVRMRVRDALLLLLKKHGENSNEINVSREDLASLVGTSSETAIRTLSEFKADGLIEVNRGEIKILNPQKLAELSF